MAYGIAEILIHLKEAKTASASLASVVPGTTTTNHSQYNINNFRVRTSSKDSFTIEGIEMISPPISLKICSPLLAGDGYINDFAVNNAGKEGGNESNQDTNNTDVADAGGANKNLMGNFLDTEIESSPFVISSPSFSPLKEINDSNTDNDVNDDFLTKLNSLAQFSGEDEDLDNIETTNKVVERGSTVAHTKKEGSEGGQYNEKLACHLFGVILYEMFSSTSSTKSW